MSVSNRMDLSLSVESALVDVSDLVGMSIDCGLVFVGWLGRGNTALHCTHHALSHGLKVLSFLSVFV